MAAGPKVFQCFFGILARTFHKFPRPQRGSSMPDPWLRYTLGQGPEVSKDVGDQINGPVHIYPWLRPSQQRVGDLPLQSAPEEGSGLYG